MLSPLKLFIKIRSILIGCQCFYRSSAKKKKHSESDSNDTVPLSLYLDV